MMVCDYGMSQRVRALPSARDAQARWQLLSDETARLIDAEASRLVEEAEELARAALAASRAALERVALALMDRETLLLEEIDTLAGPPPTLPGRNGGGVKGRVAAGAEQAGPTPYR